MIEVICEGGPCDGMTCTGWPNEERLCCNYGTHRQAVYTIDAGRKVAVLKPGTEARMTTEEDRQAARGN